MAQRNGGSAQRTDASSPAVSLLEVEPDLGAFLTEESLAEARRFALPTRTLKRGASVFEVIEQTDAFGAIVMEGLLLQGVQIGERPALRLVEPGSVVPFTRSTPPLPVATVSVRAATLSRIVLLDRHLLVAVHRWPQLASLIYGRAVQSSEPLTTQLAIAHLSRVDERLMALMWLLADNWGHVTPAGIRLRLALTHDALGELVGAQRSTVTLALKELAQRGSLIKQDQDWVILDPPPEPHAAELEPPRLLDAPRARSDWSPPAELEPHDGQRLAALRAELARLKEKYASEREKYAPERAYADELRQEARQLLARSRELFDDARALGQIPEANVPRTPSTSPSKL